MVKGLCHEDIYSDMESAAAGTAIKPASHCSGSRLRPLHPGLPRFIIESPFIVVPGCEGPCKRAWCRRCLHANQLGHAERAGAGRWAGERAGGRAGGRLTIVDPAEAGGRADRLAPAAAVVLVSRVALHLGRGRAGRRGSGGARPAYWRHQQQAAWNGDRNKHAPHEPGTALKTRLGVPASAVPLREA